MNPSTSFKRPRTIMLTKLQITDLKHHLLTIPHYRLPTYNITYSLNRPPAFNITYSHSRLHAYNTSYSLNWLHAYNTSYSHNRLHAFNITYSHNRLPAFNITYSPPHSCTVSHHLLCRYMYNVGNICHYTCIYLYND